MTRLFLFGAAEKGPLHTPCVCRSLAELHERYGNPPYESLGIDSAIQALFFHKELIFFRVEEEGLTQEEYLHGLSLLRSEETLKPISAVWMPGVGSNTLLSSGAAVCSACQAILILTDKDFYDYLAT